MRMISRQRSGLRAALISACACALLACGGSSSSGAAPELDGGSDTSPRDAGRGGDAFVPQDAGAPADTLAPDDAGSDVAEAPAPPPPPLALEGACTDTIDAVYLPRSGLPPKTAATRGDVIRCARDLDLDAATVSSQLTAKSIVLDGAPGAVRVLRIAFRTERADGVDGESSARVYLPETPRSGPLPVIVVAHPTEGLAAGCAPSKLADHLQDLALPWAARGYAVIAPDFAGLGTTGVQGYLDGRDTAHSVLDGARALRKLLVPGAFSAKVALVGYSQGGGAVLSAQSIAGAYGCDGELAAVVAFAPQWPTRLNSFGFVDLLRSPGALTITTGITKSVVAVMRTYAWFANYVGASSAGLGFDAGLRDGLVSSLQSLCVKPLGGAIQGMAFHVGDLLEGSLREGVLACIDGDAVKCTGPAKDFYAYLLDGALHGDPKGAPILYVQGLSDLIMPANEEAACNVDALAKDGVTPQICSDGPATHTDVVQRNITFAQRWVEAKLAGAAPPTCASTTLPTCAP